MKTKLTRYEIAVSLIALYSLVLIVLELLWIFGITSLIFDATSNAWYIWIPIFTIVLGIIGIKKGSIRRLISIPSILIISMWVVLAIFVKCVVGAF
ncbi:hypothetical protein P4C99_22035 [Pontiellaceae bacterium B1224]|nr:hypothetical protein [Pontiellaceae bacterium B1224]